MRISSIVVALPFALLLAPQDAHAVCARTSLFGPFPQATFGGTGISNLNVLQNYCDTTNTLALTATNRYSSPLLSNDGISTFFATAGYDTHAPGTYAKWNFDFYVGGSNATGFYSLLMDTDPGAGQTFLQYDFVGANENSWNIGMGFYGGDPTAAGQYTYTLIEWRNAAHTLRFGQVSIEVDVSGTTVAPEPASMLLITTGLFGIGAVARRRKRAV